MEIAGEYCDTLLFVLTGMDLSDRARTLLAELEPVLKSRVESNAYPAGILPWGTVTVCRYSFNERSREIVAGATDHLFGWLEPDLPSDLCLLRDAIPWLTTMASDGVGVLSLSDVEHDHVTRLLPRLRLLPLP